MRRIILIATLFMALFAIQISPTQADGGINTTQLSELVLREVFARASNMFWDELHASPDELRSAYQKGECSLFEIDRITFRVEVGGNIGIIILTGSF